MKVLILDNSSDTTGASKALLQTCLPLCRDGFEFVFGLPAGSPAAANFRAQNLRVQEFAWLELGRSLGKIVFYLPRLLWNAATVARVVRSLGIDVIHGNDIYNLAGLAAKPLAGVPVVTHVRRMPESFPGPLYRLWSRLHLLFADHVVAVSEANRAGLPPNGKTTVIYDPLPPPERHPAYVPRPALERRARVLVLANFTPGKGHGYAVEILARLGRERPDWSFELDLVGGLLGLESNRLYREKLRQACEGLPANVTIRFPDEAKDVEAAMKSYDVVFNLSDSESFSRVSLEALFYGVPLLATDVGGTREMLLGGELGMLVPRGDVAAMTKTFQDFLDDDARRLGYSRRSGPAVRATFASEIATERLKAVYQAVGRR